MMTVKTFPKGYVVQDCNDCCKSGLSACTECLEQAEYEANRKCSDGFQLQMEVDNYELAK